MNQKTQATLNRSFSSTIRSRGKFYFRNGAVKNVQISTNFVSAKISGTQNYSVVVTFDDELVPQSMSCSCPYFARDNCKHLAALLFHLDSVGFWVTHEKENDSSQLFTNEAPKKTTYIQKKIILNRKLNVFASEAKDTEKKTNKIEYRLGYSIYNGGHYTEISPVRIRLRKDGTISNVSAAHKISFDKFPDIELKEKLILDYLSGYGNNTIYPGTQHYNQSNINQNMMFNEILTFLSDKDVFFKMKYSGTYSPVTLLPEERAEAKLSISENNEDLILELIVTINEEKIKLTQKILPILDMPLWVYREETIFKVNNITYEQFEYFKENDFKISIPKDYLDVFEKNFLPQIASKLPIVSDKYGVEEVRVTPSKKIFLDEKDASLIMQIKFGYGGADFNYNADENFTSLFDDGIIKTIYRDKGFEENAIEEIKSLHVKTIDAGTFSPRKDPLDFLFKNFEYFKEKKFEIFGEDNLSKFKINNAKPKVSFNVSSGIDWFDVTTEVNFDGVGVSFSELVATIKEKKKYLKLSDGSSGVLPDNWVKKFQQTLSFGELESESVRFSKIQALALETILDEADNFEIDERFKEHVEKLKSFNKIKKASIPRSFNGQLREYQKRGVDWLYFLKEFSFGGILADDMGLGKTIQSIVLLLKEKKENKNYTNLIVAPTSVIFNWVDEINKFAPSLSLHSHTGIERERDSNGRLNNYDVVLTTYGVLLRDIEFLKDVQFHYVILDESQKIKNPTSKTGRAVRVLKSDYRICLTGTPIENNLTELWSQMAFLNPGLLGTFKKFNDTFVKPISKDNDSSALDMLKRTIYPFILRRNKNVVAKDLPEKTETIHFCKMDKGQERVYNFWKKSIKIEILKEVAEKGANKSGFKVMEGLLRLRQICNHPILVQADYKKESSKFEEFKLMLTKVVAEGHKVLVFSQFVKMLEIMKQFLDENRIKYEYLTGSTRNREERVKNFKKNGEIKVFLISLKAGGFGLNLTEADYVFHYDPWWNPAVEIQATDRTHRIGQNKNVFVYKFITKNSVEEKILFLQEKKKALVEEIISTETSLLKNLTKKDIEVLFE